MSASDVQDFLVELGTEELPPLALPELERAFADGVRAGLTEAALPLVKLALSLRPRDGLRLRHASRPPHTRSSRGARRPSPDPRP